jgi:hypothetical protein
MDEEDIPRDYGWCRSRREISCGAAFPSLTFKGNGYTSRERATDFNLLRCAEVCLENGYKYFVIVDGKECANDHFMSKH